jgi:hypothetical protein
MRVLTGLQTRILDELLKKPRKYDDMAADLGITRCSLNNNLYWLRQASGVQSTWQLVQWWRRVKEIRMKIQPVKPLCFKVPIGEQNCTFFSQGDGAATHACANNDGHEGDCRCECGYQWRAK